MADDGGERHVTTTYNLQGTTHTFVTVQVSYTVTLTPANPTVAVDGQPQPLQGGSHSRVQRPLARLCLDVARHPWNAE